MPRPVNTSRLQAAFSQLGQANARQANLELQQREMERQERAATGALLGSIAGGAIGGPAGAQVGGFLGTRLAGGRATPGQATAAGMALGQAMQPTQQEQQLAAQRELLQARQQPTQQQEFERVFQPVQVTPEEVAMERQPPQPMMAQDQDIMTLQAAQVREQPTGVLGLETAQPEVPLAPAPTPQDAAIADQLNKRFRQAAVDTTPQQVRPVRQTQQAPTISSYEQKLQSQVEQSQRILSQPGLSDMAIAMEQQNLARARNRFDSFQREKALLQEKARLRGDQAKDPKLYRIERGGEDVFVGTANDLLSFKREKGDRAFQVGKEGQSLRDLRNIQQLEPAVLEDLTPLQIRERADEVAAGGLFQDRNRAKALKNKAELESSKNTREVRKETAQLNRQNYSLERSSEIKNKIDDLEGQGLILPEEAQKRRKELFNREQKILKIKEQRAIKAKEREPFLNTLAMQDTLNGILDYKDLFKDIAWENELKKFTYRFGQATGQTKNRLQELNNLIAKGQLLFASEMVKGAASESDQQRVNEAFVQLGTAPDTAVKVLRDYGTVLNRQVNSQFDEWNQTKDITPLLERYHQEFNQKNQLLANTNPDSFRQTQSVQRPALAPSQPTIPAYRQGVTVTVGGKTYKPLNREQYQILIRARQRQEQ